jgi:hypothetical protein
MGEPGGGNATPSLNVEVDVIRGRGIQTVFGRRPNAANGVLADVWPGTASTRPLPTAPKPMFVVSTGADQFGVSGAQLVIVNFIDEDGDWRNSDLLPMAAATPVPVTYKPDDGILGDSSRPPRGPTPPSGESIVANVFRVQDAFSVVALGATQAAPRVNNLGVISVIDGAAVQFDVIPIGAGRSRSAAFHVPRNKTARLTSAPIGTAKGRGESFIGTTFGLGTAWQIVPIASIESATVLFESDPAATPISPRSDLAGLILPANVIDVTFLMQFRLVPI